MARERAHQKRFLLREIIKRNYLNKLNNFISNSNYMSCIYNVSGEYLCQNNKNLIIEHYTPKFNPRSFIK
jgi:hypothetical protein